MAQGAGPEISLSPGWVVLDDTLGQGGVQPRWRITALNRKTGRQFVVDSSRREGPDPADGMFDTFALFGSELVWSYDVCHKSCAHGTRTYRYQGSRVAWMNLSTRRRRILYSTHTGCSATFVDVWGNTAVWHDEGACWGRRSGSNVLIENLRTRRVRQLTHNGVSSEAVTNGRFVAWSQGGGRFAPGPVVLMNLSTGRKSVVSYLCAGNRTGVCRKKGADSEADAPVMSGSLLVWGDQYTYLYARDLRTGIDYRLYAGSGQHDVPESDLSSPAGNEMVWNAAYADQAHPIFGVAKVP